MREAPRGIGLLFKGRRETPPFPLGSAGFSGVSVAIYAYKRYRRSLPKQAPTAGQLVEDQWFDASSDEGARQAVEQAYLPKFVWKTDFAMLYNEDMELVLLWLDENH